MTTEKIKLTQAQMRILHMMALGRTVKRGEGSSVLANDKKLCNMDSMNALESKGIVVKATHSTWNMTDVGQRVANELFPGK